MAPSTSTSPDSFLIPGEAASPNSPWTINHDSTAWSFILTDSGLTSATPTGADLVVSSSLFNGISFSNSGNAPIFQNDSPVVSDQQDSTPQTPILGAVLAMIPPTTTPLNSAIAFATVRSDFGVAPSNSVPLLISLVNAIDQSGTLQLKLNTLTTTRNALWAVPGNPYRLSISMTFDFIESSSVSSIQTFLNQQFGLGLSLNIVNPQIVMTTTRDYSPTQSTPSTLISSLTYRMEILLQITTFRVRMIFTPDEMSLVLTDRGNAPSGSSIYQRLSSEVMSNNAVAGAVPNGLGPSDLPGSSASDAINRVLSEISLWYVQIGMNSQSGTNAEPPSLFNVFWQVGLLALCNIGSSTKGVLVSLTLDTRISLFPGQLYFSKDAPSADASRRYDYESWTDFPPSIMARFPNNIDASIDFAAMLGVKPPPQIPTSITEGTITYSKPTSGDGYTLHLSFDLTSNPAATNPNLSSNPIPSGFDWSSITLNLILQNDGSQTAVGVQALAAMDLGPSPQGNSNAMLYLDLEYASSNWLLQAKADAVYISSIAHYFDSSKAVGALGNGNMALENLNMLYTYNTTGDASSFLITATLTLGELELDLYYQYISPSSGSEQSAAQKMWGSKPPHQVTTLQSGWVFEAYLGATSPGSTVKSVVSSITSKTVTLPGFVGNIPITPTAGGNSTVALKLESDNTSGNVVLVVRLVLQDLDVTFASLWTANTSKLAFRIGVDKIPLLNSIPLVQQLPQFFDKLEYVYVADGSSDGGFTAAELGIVNGFLPSGAPQFVYKLSNSGAGTASLVVLQAGHHFIILNGTDIVLDHIFQDASSEGTSEAIVARKNITRRGIRELDTLIGDAPPTKGNLDVQLPFLSIDGVSLQFKQGSLYMDVDGTMVLGPIQGSVIGFEVVLNISQIQLNDLKNIPITFGIHGLSISVDEPPLQIAGVFIHDQVPATSATAPSGSSSGMVDRYMGGVSVGFEEWQFTAVGAYEVISSGQNSYKSIFVYAKLNGPLFTLAFATVSGVRAGFGYNSIVRSPTMAELPSFPFLSGSDEDGGGADPSVILQKMMGTGGSAAAAWVSPKDDSYWVAAGLTLTALGILSITAVLMLGFHDSGVVISVFADGIAQLPPDAPEDATLFYVEIYMLAELNTVDGYFTVQASLAPSSHVLVSSCRLTGGFALVNWFNPNAHSGDFVFTVGGYHPAYKPPAWYPVPARIGVSFTLGSMVKVTGTTYFAVTPKCVMGGGALHMGLDVGPVSAWLDIALDVFIQFKPFHYIADLSVSVGCAISIRVWFVHIRISVSVGAALHIEGPKPFGGYANVDYYLFSFTIHFGNTSTAPDPASLHDFFGMVKTPGPAPSGLSVTPDLAMNQLTFVLTAGLYPTSPPPTSSTSFPDSGANSNWNVKAGILAFNIDCDFALTTAAIVNSLPPESGTDQLPLPVTAVLDPSGNTAPIFHSKPMHAFSSDTFTSVLTITVWLLSPEDETTKLRIIKDCRGTFIMKPVPIALWGAYDPDADLTTPDTPTTTLAMGVTVLPPKPNTSPSALQTFDPSIAFGESLGSWPLPALEGLQDVLLASEQKTDYPQTARDWTAFAGKGEPILGGVVGADGKPGPGLLVMAAQTLGWDVPTPASLTGTQSQGSDGTLPWLLNGEIPDMLILGLGTQYPVLPRYSASGTTSGS